MEVKNLPMVIEQPNSVTHNPNVVYSPHPISAGIDRKLFYDNFLENESLGDYLDRLNLMPPVRENFILTINGIVISFDDSYKFFPRNGDMVIMRASVHDGGGDKNKALRTILTIAVLIASQGTLAGWVGMMTYTSVAVGSAVVVIGGMLLITALVPVSISTITETEPSPTYSLTGSANRARPYEPLPLVFGTVRMYADHGARPYTEYIGRDQILIQVFNFGLSDVSYTDYKIGDTPITDYDDYEIEESVDFTGVLDSFPGNVDSLAGADLVTNKDTFIERTSSIDTTRLTIDVSGISYFENAEVGVREARVKLTAEYRIAGSSDPWIGFFSVSIFGITINISDRYIINGDKETLRLSYTRYVPKGQYEVRVMLHDEAYLVSHSLSCDDNGENCVQNTFYEPKILNVGEMVQFLAFDQLKSYQPDDSDYSNQKRLCLSIKANSQLSGRIDAFNVIASSKVLVWTDPTWTNQVSSNPAWQFLSLARGKFDGSRRLYGAGLADSRIDIETIKLWGAWCDAKSLECNVVFDSKMTVIDMLNTIARCGRATATWAGGTLGVIYDEANKPATSVFGMSNIIKNSFSVNYVTINQVDEVVVAFVNPDLNWQQDTVRAVVPGVTSPVNSVTINLPGVTSETQAGKEANLIAAEQVYRRRIITWETDIEGLTVQRGEVAVLSHDVTQWDYSGRLISGTTTTLVLDKNVPFVPNTQHYIGVKFPDGTYEIVDVAFSGQSNVIEYPENFENVVWTKTNISVFQDNINAPDGKLTADKIVPTVTNDLSSIASNSGIVGIGDDVGSCHFKAGEYTKVQLSLYNVTDGIRGTTNYDLSSGTIHSGPGAIDSEGDGWYRCSVDDATTLTTDSLLIKVLDDTWSDTFAGNGFDGIYAWGAMLNSGTVLLDYINETNSLNLITALSASPDADVDNDPIDYLWFFAPKATPGKLVKITDVAPLSEYRVKITATDEEDDYYLSESNTYTYITPSTFISNIPTISGLELGETLSIVGTGFIAKVNVSWSVSGEYGGAFIRAGDADIPMKDIGRTLDTSFEFEWPIGKEVIVEVVCYNLKFESSDVSIDTQTLLLVGKSAPPTDVTSMTVSKVETGFLVEWGAVLDIDLLEYEIRFGPWVDSVVLDNIRSLSYLHSNPPVGTNSYTIKAIDTSGNYSVNEFSVEHTVYPPADIVDLLASIESGKLVLTWSIEATSYPIATFEIREGTVWSTAAFITKTAATSLLVNITTGGSKTYLVKAIDIHGNESVNAGSDSITVTLPETPVMTVTYDAGTALLSWTESTGSSPIEHYEVSNSAGVIAEIKNTNYQVVVTWLSESFSVVAVDVNGLRSLAGGTVSTITPPSVSNLSVEIIDNNVLLRWDESLGTLPIKAYEIRRGDVYATADVLQEINGTFASFFEIESGTYKYWVTGFDTALNDGTPFSISAIVNQPPDYILNVDWSDDFTGVKTNAVLCQCTGSMIAPVDSTETWTEHFVDNSWTTPQAQITAGYDYYIEPSTATGSYVQEFDYGTELASTLVKIIADRSVIDGSPVITPNIKVKKLSGDAWTDLGNVWSAFATEFRYVQATLNFASTGGDDLIQINSLNVVLDSKLKNDGGSDSVTNASTGLTVNFNVSFIDVTSITVSPNTTSNVTAIFDFTDTPNPTSFTVYLLDPTDGTKLTGDFSWSARGY